jgi:lipopolysaccharide export system ATP-binding protein
MATVLEARDLVKVYGSRKVVDGVSLKVETGEIVGLLGRNGAGKTTTFKAIVGLIRPQSGEIHLNGEEITRLPIYKRARRGMGFLSQEPSVFQRLTVEENLLAILELIGGSADRERHARARSLLEEFGLAQVSRQKAYTLSGGETRRLEICRSMLTHPAIMLLDEPFAGVDPIAVADLQGLIRRLKEKSISVLLTDHNVRETLQVTDRSYIIDQGVVIAQGSRAEIVDNPLVRERYLGQNFRI